jgi:selenocysteine lyase/cysteine desulfurase
MRAADAAFSCRMLAADMFGVREPENVVFTSNATHGLNIAIKSLVKSGMRVLVSGYEHNAVMRPLKAIGADIVVASSELFEPEMAVFAFERKLRDADVVICNHVSNVFGYILPVQRIARLCDERGIPFILDASQSAGVIDIDLAQLCARFIAMPGHKGLYGPQGTGLLLCAETPVGIMQGGTGSNSLSRDMPDFLPDALEAGTHNMPGIIGLMQGMEFVHKRGAERIMEHERELIRVASDGLTMLDRVRVYRSEHLFSQGGVVSFTVRDASCEQVGEELSRRGVAVRAGLHCAPDAHRTAGTIDTGTIRVSVSAFNTKTEICRFLDILRDIVAKI